MIHYHEEMNYLKKANILQILIVSFFLSYCGKEKTVVEKPVKEEKSESEDAPW